MKSTIIEGVEYKLTPIKKENKTVALFILTMPKNNSWNGKWTGEGNLYAYSQVAFRRGKPIYSNLKEGNFYYDFGDGPGAVVVHVAVGRDRGGEGYSHLRRVIRVISG